VPPSPAVQPLVVQFWPGWPSAPGQPESAGFPAADPGPVVVVDVELVADAVVVEVLAASEQVAPAAPPGGGAGAPGEASGLAPTAPATEAARMTSAIRKRRR
jgi:hypothetical protein